ncbi:MAG: hypothetical protein JWN75_634 [Candidatus Saccharibacteria bacterium]|nr:hypothetical protein [Candidatus Saccharibacteria bacterium]
MNAVIYHEVDPKIVDSVLQNGLKTENDGAKTDSQIKKIDQFLDTHLPDDSPAGLNRQNVIYGYVSADDKILDIKSSDMIAINDFVDKSDAVLLRIEVDAAKCYVSDLDMYDTIKRAMELKEQDSTLEDLATKYWQRVVTFDTFELGTINRPEVMVPYDIPPTDISKVE